MRFVLHCKCEFVLFLRIFGISPSSCSLLCSKTMQCGIVCHNKNTSLRLVVKVDRPFYFNATSSPRLRLGLHLFAL